MIAAAFTGTDELDWFRRTRAACTVRKCAVHGNYDGILIQDTGSARVEHCTVYSNRCSGIFVGYDHRGSATIIENEAFTNAYNGVY